MTWYAVSSLVAIRKAKDPEGPWLVYENVILVEATDVDDARRAGEIISNEEVAIDDSFTIDGDATVKKFAGVRKVISISNPHPLDLDQDRPVSGTEITYSLFRVDSETDLNKLANGDQLCIEYLE